MATVSELLQRKRPQLQKQYPGKWVALSLDGEIVAHAPSEKRLWKKIAHRVEQGEHLIILYIETPEERGMACLLLAKSF